VALRRKRKYQGATWAPPSQGVDLHDGAWCRKCRMRHGYSVMKVGYDKRNDGSFVMLWCCPKTGEVIQEMVLLHKEEQDNVSADPDRELEGQQED
jgi:hypothetical protein